MSKKRLMADIAPDELSDPESGPENVVQLPELFTVSEWKPGIMQWRCTLCPFDTIVSEAYMRAHIAAMHTPKPPKIVTRASPVYDRFGNPIQVVELEK